MKPPERTWSRLLLVCALACGAGLAVLAGLGSPPVRSHAGAPGARHPLDPLSTDEIEQAARTLKREQHLPDGVLLPVLVLHEPPKEQVQAHQPGQPFPREAFVVVFDRTTNETHEAVVDLVGDQVKSYQSVPGAQPRVLGKEYDDVPDLVRADPRVQVALATRGLIHPEQVYVELWGTSSLPEAGQPEGARLARVLFYDTREGSNAYIRPVGGLMAVVNLNTRKVLRVVDRDAVPISNNRDNIFDPKQLGQPRTAPLKPLQVQQPQGTSFTVDGHEVRWQNWSFRFANHPREALVLYQVAYNDHGKVRPVLYRGSLAELVVPYGEPGEFWDWRAPFDEGEYSLGLLTMPLSRKQVPQDALLLDSVFADDEGGWFVSPASVAVYERDGGVLWQHTDLESRRLECRRARELVVTCEVVAGNYDYGLSWIFGQDGQLRVEVELGGIPLARAAAAIICKRCTGTGPAGEAEDGHGTVVAPHIVAPNHQHWFCFRLDMDVDGPANTVSELSVRPAAAGAAFTLEERVLATEQEAACDLDLGSQRRWKVYNTGTRTALGHYPGYVLEPGENTVPLQAADSSIRQRAAFINHHLWVTRYKPEEQYPAGDYPTGSRGGEGLPSYVANNEKLTGEDVVLWYACGVTHVPRPEDWPVMPSVRVGFRLVPHGFFTRNPALDVPDR
jgi:primary-amine oxidase